MSIPNPFDSLPNQEHSKFPLGRLVITRNAAGALNVTDVIASLHRHASGDWGNCCDADRESNNLAVADQSRILSIYQDRSKTLFWIITEGDRSATTILLPDDY